MYGFCAVCLILLGVGTVISEKLIETIAWQQLQYRHLPGGANFIGANNIPFGIAFHPKSSRLFVGVARRAEGIPATLSYLNVDLNSLGTQRNPALHAYPNYQTHTLNGLRPSADANKIISVYRPRIDICDRLWFVDTGVLEFPNNQIIVQRPSIWIVDLNTDRLIRRFEIPTALVDHGVGLAAITIDVIDDTTNNCGNTFAYIPDWRSNNMIVYNYASNKAYVVRHNSFSFDPVQGNFDVDNLQFAWNDGVFSVALSNRNSDSYKFAFFHAMCSDKEFHVSTRILRNETLATRSYHGNDFRVLGERGGFNSQTGPHAYDPAGNVMISGHLQRNSVECWNFHDRFERKNIAVIDKSNEYLYYPTDLIIDSTSTIWVLANKLPRHIYSKLSFTENNFYITRAKVDDAIRGTKCDKRSSNSGLIFSRNDVSSSDTFKYEEED